jgi:hypothetical protein
LKHRSPDSIKNEFGRLGKSDIKFNLMSILTLCNDPIERIHPPADEEFFQTESMSEDDPIVSWTLDDDLASTIHIRYFFQLFWLRSRNVIYLIQCLSQLTSVFPSISRSCDCVILPFSRLVLPMASVYGLNGLNGYRTRENGRRFAASDETTNTIPKISISFRIACSNERSIARIGQMTRLLFDRNRLQSMRDLTVDV